MITVLLFCPTHEFDLSNCSFLNGSCLFLTLTLTQYRDTNHRQDNYHHYNRRDQPRQHNDRTFYRNDQRRPNIDSYRRTHPRYSNSDRRPQNRPFDNYDEEFPVSDLSETTRKQRYSNRNFRDQRSSKSNWIRV